MILIIVCCILSLTLLRHKFGIAENYAFFGVTIFSSNLVCVKNMTNRKSGFGMLWYVGSILGYV